MTRYRRLYSSGGVYFLTMVTAQRRPLFDGPEARAALSAAIRDTRARRPFDIVAMCLLPDHLHCVWSLPEGDADFSKRVSSVKAAFSRQYGRVDPGNTAVSESRKRRGEAGFWQRRFWEHLVRNEEEFGRICDYIHYNPVKHGLAMRALDWPWSSLQRFVSDGICAADWGGKVEPWMKELNCAGE